MLQLRRPPEPSDFTERARQAYLQVEAAISAAEPPTFEPPLWSDYKSIVGASWAIDGLARCRSASWFRVQPGEAGRQGVAFQRERRRDRRRSQEMFADVGYDEVILSQG